MTITDDRAGNPALHAIRGVIILITALLALSSLSGCSTGLGVSRQDDLAGTRSNAADSYSGRYMASYHGFTGTETLFGGTGKRATIHVTGRVSGTQGTGTILVTDGSDMKRPLPIYRGTFDQTYALDGVSFYIYASGDNFTGSLTLISKEE